jgi:cholesterol oxidase
MAQRAYLPITRRTFVRTAVIGGATLGALGCQSSERVDTLILGSGFGGSIVAFRLAMAGHRTVMLERGKRWTVNTPGEDVFSSMAPGMVDRRASWMTGRMPLPGYPPSRPTERYAGILERAYGNGIDVVCAAGVGGGSLVYSGMMVRPERQFSDETFPQVSYDTMTPYYEMVRTMMNPGRLPDDLLARPEWTATRTFLEQAEAAGYRAERLLCAFDFEKARLELDGSIPPQLITGSYIYGLNSGAKATLDQSYLGMAEMSGMCEVRPLHWAQTITQHADGYSVVYHRIDETGVVLEEKQIFARRLFVSCGTLNTNGLLRRSKAEGGLPNLPDEVGEGFGNNGLHIKARRNIGVNTGVAQAGPACAMLYDHENRLSMENGPAPVGGETLISTGIGIPTGRGTIGWDAAMGKVSVEWNNANDMQAQEATTNVIAQLNRVNGGEETTLFDLGAPITFHPLGGCVLGEATDLFGRLRNHPGLYVVDGSLIPGVTPCANPFWTVSANAERCIETILREDFGAMV